MNMQERVFLPASGQVSEIELAASLFAKQYGSVHVYIRGNVLDANNTLVYLSKWYTIAATSTSLNLIGVGDMSKDDEHFSWVSPTEHGEIQLTTLQETKEPQAA